MLGDTGELLARLLKFRDERDWKKFHLPKDLAISLSVEAAELLEVFQWIDPLAPPDERLVESVSDEAADVLSYLLLLSHELGFDLLEAAHQKISRNEKRFPVSSSRGIAKPLDEEAK